MLITAQGTTEKIDDNSYKINFEFPKIFLDKFDYKISVRSISFEINSETAPARFSLRTNLIDKNPLNPKQEILSFIPETTYGIAYFSPRNLFEYKIQLKEVHTADYNLSYTKSLDPTYTIEISNIYIIFEILRDVRI